MPATSSGNCWKFTGTGYSITNMVTLRSSSAGSYWYLNMPPPQNLWVIDTRLTHFCHEKQRIYWPFLPWSFLYQHIPSVFFPPQADLSAARQTRIFTTETRRHRGKKRRRGVIKSEISKSHIDNACHKSGNLRFDNTVFNGEGEEFLITEPLDFCAHFTSPLS